MPAKRTLGIRAQIDREIASLDNERARLLAARAALDRDRPRRFSQDDVAAFLADHPDSTYSDVADGLGASPTNVAAHLKRGRQAGRFRNSNGKWSLS
ncbi:MAG TPA: hypothetical protein VND98_09800 [Solirubrobacterales bacterium]|nr:hypothetical protein [Solirubrobacterales bacterium]